jgi:uncharacterized protein
VSYQKGMDAYKAGDYTEALNIFRPLAERGHGMAQFQLGKMYDYGQGVGADKARAVAWWRKALEQRDGEVHARLSTWYGVDLRGVVPDHGRAAAWWLKAAKQGDAEAQYNIGNMHYNGQGVTQDYAQAAEWWRMAAEQGHGMAQFRLGRTYRKGEGVVLDYAQAYKWLILASANGTEMSDEFQDDVINSMTGEQIAEARELAREWVEKRPK